MPSIQDFQKTKKTVNKTKTKKFAIPESKTGQTRRPRTGRTTVRSKKFTLSFVGSNILKSTFPRSFVLIEKVTQEWIKGGQFKNLPIANRTVQHYVGQALRILKGA